MHERLASDSEHALGWGFKAASCHSIQVYATASIGDEKTEENFSCSVEHRTQHIGDDPWNQSGERGKICSCTWKVRGLDGSG